MEILLDKETVFLSETVYDGQTEQGIELDYILPDYYADIFKILKCSLTPCIVSYNVSGTQLYIDGVVYVRVLYLSADSNDINCIEQRYTYSKTVELSHETKQPRVTITPKADYCTCRAVSGRRVDIRGAVSLKIKVSGCCESTLLSNAKGAGLQVYKHKLSYCGSRLYASRQYAVREDIETGSGEGIYAVVSSSCSAAVSDTKIVADKVVIKGEAKVKALYLTKKSDGSIRHEVMEASVPLSQIIDVEGITDEHSCYAELNVMDCDLEIKSGDDGENRVFGCNITVDCKVGAYKEMTVSPVCDLYSIEYETTFSEIPMKIEHTPQILSCSSSLKSTVECSDGKISEVYDCRCDILSSAVRCSETGKPVVFGQMLIVVYGKNEEGKPVVMDKTENYEIEHDITVEENAFNLNSLVTTGNVSYSIADDGSVEVRVLLNSGGMLYRVETINAISEISVNEDRPKSCDKEYALKLYYAETGEKIWDIAKKYNTSAEAVSSENELETDTLESSCMLLIPMV